MTGRHERRVNQFVGFLVCMSFKFLITFLRAFEEIGDVPPQRLYHPEEDTAGGN